MSASALPTAPVSAARRTSAPWWAEAVIYQVYPRSFADGNGDGVGDLAGLIARLPALSALGVDALWLSPFYPSPQADAGYDVADYRDVEPTYGTLADADLLLRRAHARGIRVIVDLVPNHTSAQHRWFRAALAAGPGSAERARYHFRDGRGEGGALPPNGWQSMFGGPAWTRVADGQWYLHLFAPEQPDLNWDHDEVVEEFHDVLRFWLDRGVDGFRIDVAHALTKDPALPEAPTPPADWDEGHFAYIPASGHPFLDRDDVHEIYRGWRRVLDAYDDRVFVAEAWVRDPGRLALYLRPDELHTAFNFSLMTTAWDATQLRRAIDATLDGLSSVGAPATWVLSNHDVVRHRTRLGDGDLGLRRATAATALILALPGGAYLYQGEELGLPEVLDIEPDRRRDPTFRRTGGERPGRDGCRIPLPWSGAEPPYGFGTSADALWLPQPDDWAALTYAAQEADPGSTLSLYRALLAARREHPDLGVGGDLRWLEAGPDVLALRRGDGFGAVVNLGETALPLPAELAGGRQIVATAPLGDDGTLPPDATVWLDLRAD